MESDWSQLSTWEPHQVCDCGELEVLVVTYHSGWGDAMGRACPWCFGGRGAPTWVHGVWLDGECRTGAPELLVELYIVAFRRAAVRRRPDIEVRGHEDALGLWNVLAGRQQWDPLVAKAWLLMMRDPTMSLGEGRALMRPAWAPQQPPPRSDVPVDDATWDELRDHRGRLERAMQEHAADLPPPSTDAGAEWWRDAQSVALAAGRTEEATAAVAFDMVHGELQARRGHSLLEVAERVAGIWAGGVHDMARQSLDRTETLLGRTVPVGRDEVLAQCLALKRVLGILFVVLAPSDVRPMLVVWYADQVRTAAEAADPRARLDLLPDERTIAAMVETLGRTPGS